MSALTSDSASMTPNSATPQALHENHQVWTLDNHKPIKWWQFLMVVAVCPNVHQEAWKVGSSWMIRRSQMKMIRPSQLQMSRTLWSWFGLWIQPLKTSVLIISVIHWQWNSSSYHISYSLAMRTWWIQTLRINPKNMK